MRIGPIPDGQGGQVNLEVPDEWLRERMAAEPRKSPAQIIFDAMKDKATATIFRTLPAMTVSQAVRRALLEARNTPR